jgi:hypothetical protein
VSNLRLIPIELRRANAFVAQFHRHSRPVRGQKFSVAVVKAGESMVHGVAIAGRPIARGLQDGFTIEILRVCTDGARNACSILYGACCRAAAAMGYRTAVTYTLASEGGASLRAAGFRPAGEVKERQWGCVSRPREDRDLVGDKVRWERSL